jgi:hypothetical protein
VPPRLRAGPAPFAAHSWSGRMARFLAVGALLLAAQVGAFLLALHRYETGLGTRPAGAVDWSPPGGGALVIALFVTGQVLLLGFLAWKYAEGEAVEPVANVTEEGVLSGSLS